MENQFQFKPFDQVLVRDHDKDPWFTAHYSHFDESQQQHYCGHCYWMQCIPYNEETAHLVGTDKPYKEPKPVKWYIDSKDGSKKYDFTNEEFVEFLNDTVMNSENVVDFRVRYVPK